MAGWGRNIGAGDNQTELQGRGLAELRRQTVGQYSRLRKAAV